MAHPNDNELEAMAARLCTDHPDYMTAKAAAMLRACKSPAPEARQEGWNEAIEAAAKVADRWATDLQRQFGNGGPAAAILALKKDQTMTDTKDLTAPEHVERLADSYVIPGMPEDCRPVIVAATLRALAAKLEAAEAERDALQADMARAMEVLHSVAFRSVAPDDLGWCQRITLAFLAARQKGGEG